jgi:hypothetical protein
MSNIAHFFDLNCLIDISQSAWIVDKNKPNVPLLKISPSDFKLIKSGIFKSKGNKIEFSGQTFWLSDEMFNRLKIISLKNRINISDLVVSLQEFLNRDLIQEMKYSLKLDPILNLRNKLDDIYIICSQQTKRIFEKVISKIEEELKSNGIVIKQFYYLNENFLNQNSDEVKFKEMRLLLQHSIGYKTDSDKFVDEEITKYNFINFYDNSITTFKVETDINQLMDVIWNNTDKGLRDVIKEDLQDSQPTIFVHKIEMNEFNPISTKKVKITLPKLIKTFESFKRFNPYL